MYISSLFPRVGFFAKGKSFAEGNMEIYPEYQYF